MLLSSPSSHYRKPDFSIDTEALFSTVLLAVNDQQYAQALIACLAGVVGEVIHTGTAAQALSTLETTFVEAVILDSELPDLSCINMLRAVQQIRAGLPVISLVGGYSISTVIDLLREGAWDCQLKDAEGELRERLTLGIQRAAERRLLEIQQVEVQAQRNAFYLAAETAQDGLAVISAQGVATFTNQAFDDFCIALGDVPSPDRSIQVPALIAAHDPNVADNLRRELASHSGQDCLWSAELISRMAGNENERRYFQLTLTSVGVNACCGLNLGAVSELKRHLLWVRDISQEKQRQKFQHELLSTTTHDLKGPLGVIRLAAEMLREHSAGWQTDSAQLLEKIYASASKVLNNIDELLNIRKMEEGVITLKPACIPAATLLNELQQEYCDMAAAKRHKLVILPIAESLQIYADRVAIQRVLGNLIANAIKYCGEGGRIELSALESGAMTRISVADNGPGIEASARHKLFERYGRLKQHANIEGTGLGLYIANNIVKAHGGNIEVNSKVGSGTTFVICLPKENSLT